MNRQPTMPQWCCADCLILQANGENPTDMSEEQVTQWLANIAAIQGDSEITLGMLAEYHSCAELRVQPRRNGRDVSGYSYQEVPGRLTWNWRKPYLLKYLFARYDVVCDNGHVKSFFNEEKAMTWANDNIGPVAGAVGGECYCEQMSFSRSSCDMCGSNLGGERHAFTFWIEGE